ncbi:hypothetical protein ELZ88_24325 (plasmid) [Salmonella enterica subsp. enterica serovar Karamoja]|uniref:Uncharacterized protein n=2 Tax=Salmonella enterica TaxID=28901 RepID=A0A3T0CIS1_SALET|nr:hypothetical protein ELZ88_24325 [Salmonella enterica subsp. enterica serovar Karamoja]AZT44440.1 hypothetical protein EL007_24615 [Salmonella enterica subsp. enterica serovar Karamoja]
MLIQRNTQNVPCSVQHLTGEACTRENVQETIESVAELFTADWLNQPDAHRFQILWQRRDPLASTELYALGRAICQLRGKNLAWLKSSARDIKKGTTNAHGLITEIVTIVSVV